MKIDLLAMKRVTLFLTAGGFLVILMGCAHQPEPSAYDPPGFLMGVIHGFTILFSFIGSIFLDVRIYAFPNSGFYYDLGYLIGSATFFAGGGASAVS